MQHIQAQAEAFVFEHYGLSKQASAPQGEALRLLRRNYRQQGAISGGLRGALLGGLTGALTGEDGDRLDRALRGAGIGAVGGGLAGAAHGHYLSDPTRAHKLLYRRKVTFEDSPEKSHVEYRLRRPGRFSSEVMSKEPTWLERSAEGYDGNAAPSWKSPSESSNFAYNVMPLIPLKGKPAAKTAAKTAVAAPSPEELEMARRILDATGGFGRGLLRGSLAGAVGGGVLGGARAALSNDPRETALTGALEGAGSGALTGGLGGALTGSAAGYFGLGRDR